LREDRAWKLQKREYACIFQETLGGGGTGYVKSDNHTRVVHARGLQRANFPGEIYPSECATGLIFAGFASCSTITPKVPKRDRRKAIVIY
jgi:hypothetical protein